MHPSQLARKAFREGRTHISVTGLHAPSTFGEEGSLSLVEGACSWGMSALFVVRWEHPPPDWPWSKYALLTESWAGPPDQSQRMRVHAPSDHLKSCAGGQGVYAHDDTIWHHDVICDLGMEPPSVCICPGTNPNANSVLISIWANALQGLMSIILSKLINLLIVQLVIACNCHLWRYNLTTFTSKKLSDFQASQLSFCYLFPQCLSSIVFSLFSAWSSSL